MSSLVKNSKAAFCGRTGWKLSFFKGVIIGALVFLGIFGHAVLDVTKTDWLLTGWYDLSQHYVGWELFRASDWHFPLGLCDRSFYPYLASVIYTDSIPVLCVFFKFFSPILPASFQFLGWYGFLSFMLQGGCTKLLLRRYIKSDGICDMASIFFICCISLMERMFYHTALASHYLVLTGMLFFVYRDRLGSRKRRIALWCILGCLAVGIHFFIYAILSALFLGYILMEILEDRASAALRPDVQEIKQDALETKDGAGKSSWISLSLRSLLPYLGATFLTFYILGGFYGFVSADSTGLGEYSANLNAFFNTMGYSRIILPLKTAGPGQIEGLTYLGLGLIILLPLAIIGYIKKGRGDVKRNATLAIPVFILSAVLWILALSPKVTIGDITLAEIPVPGIIFKIWSIFRASGRFIWPVMYVLFVWILIYSSRLLKKFFAPLIFVLVCLHIYEYSHFFFTMYGNMMDPKEPHFSAEALEKEDLTGIRHVQFIHPYHFDEYYGEDVRSQMIGYTLLALRHDMTVSNFHFSRDDLDRLQLQIDMSLEMLDQGLARGDTMYVFAKREYDSNDLYGRYPNVTEINTGTEIVLLPDSRDMTAKPPKKQPEENAQGVLQPALPEDKAIKQSSAEEK